MGILNWLFGRKKNKHTSPKRYEGVPYGSKPKNPDKKEIIIDYTTLQISQVRPIRGGWRVYQRTRELQPQTHLDPNGAVQCRYTEWSEWIEFRSKYGSRWVDGDGRKLNYETGLFLEQKITARELFG